MEIIIRRRDLYVVALVLTVASSWVAYAAYENFDARQTLQGLAEVHIDEWFDSEPEGTSRDDYEYLAIVDMERPYEIFGPAFGVVHVYIRDRGDEACETFKGIEYYYRLDENGWALEHSAGCAAKQHHIRAFQHYIADGSGVHYTAIDEALGIEFDAVQAEEYLKARQEGRNPFLAGHKHDHDEGVEGAAGHAHPEPNREHPRLRYEQREKERASSAKATNEEGTTP